MKNKLYKPELLLPAGSFEMFYAAMEGGADAVYAGLKKFNARNRAKNFSFSDVYKMSQEAHSRKKKIYVTLNTLIKNNELPDLIDTLNSLNQCGIDALIVQDLAVLNIVKKLYKNLEVHASTQFGIHNSAGTEYLKQKGVVRSILSREVNLSELDLISKRLKHPSEIEIFVHGALCYSFSGQCLFSSYLGGFSANRGMCAQVCRRDFSGDKLKGNIFSLKDLQLIDYVPAFSKMGIKSLKIEGRMKSPDYAYVTAKAYRMAIDDHTKIKEAKELLESDFAREKTSWFIGKQLDDAFTTNSGTGIFAGTILEITPSGFSIETTVEIELNYRLRCRNAKDTDAKFVNVKSVSKSGTLVFIECDTKELELKDEVYIVGTKEFTYKTVPVSVKSINIKSLSRSQSDKLLSMFKLRHSKSIRNKYYLRISDLQGLDNRLINDFELIFLKADLKMLSQLDGAKIDSGLKAKLILELPKFISELKLKDYQKTLARLFSKRFNKYSLSHISQKLIVPRGAAIYANESIYSLNDVAVNYLQNEGVKEMIYSYENEYPNLLKGRDRNGIIPIYFYPELFYSRMPVRAGRELKDTAGKKYNKVVSSGFTIIYPEKPVSFTQNIQKFKSKGFSKFLIDISNEQNKNKLNEILQAAKSSSKISGASDFNMKKGLR